MMREAILAMRLADDLGDERHRARGARIDFEHVDLAVLERELHIHQAADIERQRQFAVCSSRRAIISGDSERGGNEQAESPE